MKAQSILITILATMALTVTPMANAAKGNWKQGRIYYKMVCTDCHATEAERKISPSEKTKAEWAAYFEADQHFAADQQPLSYYLSTAFRESIQEQNRAAKKMLKVSDEQLIANVKAFVEHGAKDSDQPASCN